MKTIKTAIIGSGLAGLAIAHLLKKHTTDTTKISVAVFESNDSLPRERFPFDLADTEFATLALARELNVELIPQRCTTLMPCSELMTLMIAEILQLKSKRIICKPEDWSTKENNILDIIDSMDIIDYFVRKKRTVSEVRALLQSSWLSTYADDLSQLSALDALRFISQYLHCKLTYAVKRGNHNLIAALANSLADHLFFNTSITAIERINRQWRLSFADADPQLFDLLVKAESPKTTPIYFKPNERRRIAKIDERDDSVFFVGSSTVIDAPASMHGAITSAYRLMNQQLLPALHAQLPNKDESLTPAVSIAVFKSGNDACLKEETNL